MSSNTTPADAASIAAALPPGQAMRLNALRSYSILDTPVESAFDDITLIASQICRTPIAVINLIDASRQWFKSERGLGVRETPLETSICAHAILEHDYLEVPDTTVDARFSRNPLVTADPGLRFYAGALLRTPDGHALGTVCVLDYEPRRLDEEQRAVMFALARQTMAQLELRRAMIDAERAAQTYRRVLSITNHDLRAPLTVMEASLFQLAQAMPDAASQGDINAARLASRDLMDKVKRLGDMLRVDMKPINPAVVDIADFVGAIADRWVPVAQRAGREFHVDSGAGEMTTDADSLRMILDNLISNAFKHASVGPVRLRVCQDAGMTSISVEDTGPGIPVDQQEAIFNAFHQLNATRDGLGLGLSIAQRRAELLGITIGVESSPGQGACFTVQFPA
jgi:signal transduction histidine kinase